MSKLEELIQQLCPNGVEHKKLNEAVDIRRGVRVVRSQLSSSGEYPVYQNSLTPLGYYEKYNVNADTAFVIVAGAAGEIGYSTVNFWAADDCFYFEGGKTICNKFIYYVLTKNKQLLLSKVRKASIPRLSRLAIEQIVVPVPPLEVQREIVRILDSFTELSEELTTRLSAELNARKKQYEHYQNKLLTFKKNVPYYTLSEVCDIVDYRGKTPKKVEDGIFLVTAKNIKKGYIDYDKSKEYVSPDEYSEIMRRGLPQIGDVLITTEAPCGNVAQVDRTDIALAQRVIKYRANSDILDNRFLKYVLLGAEFQTKLLAELTGGTVKGIKGSKLHRLSIPVPPLNEQRRIVSILDRFDALCNDLTSGLSVEIAARQKQYEYYRDKLLDFKEKINV